MAEEAPEDPQIAHPDDADGENLTSEDSGDETVEADDKTDLAKVLEWIGYESPTAIDALVDELGSLRDFSSLTYKDISAMVKDGVTSKMPNGRSVKIKFRMTTQLALKKTIDWAKDRTKIGAPITLRSAKIDNRATFLRAINLARERKDIRCTKRRKHLKVKIMRLL